jgi:hypothetical protein
LLAHSPCARCIDIQSQAAQIACVHFHFIAGCSIRRNAGRQTLSEKGLTALATLCEDVGLVENDAVIFNFECCDGFGDHGFGEKVYSLSGLPTPVPDSNMPPPPSAAAAEADSGAATAEDEEAPSQDADNTLALRTIEFVLGRGSMVMASDFALKALIKIWPVEGNTDSSLLGPPPFRRITDSRIDQAFTLKFDPKTLAACASAQLNKVGTSYRAPPPACHNQ